MHRRAFTLVEMLVVISIIMLLIAMMLPALGRSKENTRRTICASNLRSNMTACTAYSNDSGGALPVTGYNFGGAGYWIESKLGDKLVSSYLSNYESLYCPTALMTGMATYPSLPAQPTARWWWYDWTTIAGSTHRVMGYETTMHQNAAMPSALRAKKITDDPRLVVWADGYEAGPGGGVGIWSWRVTHYQGVNPEGTNLAFLDCSAKWSPFSQMKLRWFNSGWNVWW